MVADDRESRIGHRFLQRRTIAPQVVMKFTGHADYKSMKPYIDITEKPRQTPWMPWEKALGE